MSLRTLLLRNVTEGQTISKNVFWLFTGQLVHRALNFIAVAYAARVLGAASFGSMAFAFAFITLAFTFADLGINVLVVREHRQTPGEWQGLLSAFWYLKLILVIGSAIVTWAIFALFAVPISPLLFWLVLGVTVFDFLRDFFIAIARALERGTIESSVLIFDGVLTAVLGVLLLKTYGTLTSLVTGYLISGICAALLAALLLKIQGTTLFVRARWTHVREQLATIWPFAFAALIALSFVQVDILLLGYLRGATSVGLYAPGSRIVQILFIFPTLIGAAILPALSRSKDRVSQSLLLRRALSFTLLTSIPVVFGGILFARDIIKTLYGMAYLGGSASFAILLLMFLVYAYTIILDYYLLSVDLQNQNFLYTAIAAVCNITFAVLLIPPLGILGAATATLLAQLVNIGLTLYLTRTTLKTSFIAWADIGRYCASAYAMTFVITSFHLSLFIALPVGGAVYLLCLWILQTPLLRDGLALVRS